MTTFKYLLLLLVADACHTEHVKTPLGEIKGIIRTSHGGRKYSAFEGIPFAKPPVGDRRFEEPEPVEPWTGVWEANFPIGCAQTSLMLPNISFSLQFSEDCLYLNVYVPRDVPNPEEKLDVLAYIHGGAYMYGAAHAYSSPQWIMDHDVVLVTLNYRLGILGFLSTEDDVVSGNNGLKDQAMALKWVQQNIASFGGNPDSVTLFGESAGGSSVHMHYFSDISKGLFHRGVSWSGVALTPWSLQEQPLQKAKILAEAAGCPSSSSQELVRCLKQRPYEHLLSKMSKFFELGFTPLAPFAPVVEKGRKAFLKANPYYLTIKGKVNDVPWISSHASHEGAISVMTMKDQLKEINDNWEDWAPFYLDYNYTLPPSQWKTTARKIKEHYLGDNPINEENLLQLMQIFSDRIFLVDGEIAVREQAKVTKSPIYSYIFNYRGDDNEMRLVGHASDVIYVFGHFFGAKTLTENELKMKDVMLNMLITFAKTGKPEIKGVNWEPTQHDKLTYLQIDGFEPENIYLKTVQELTPRAFWTSLGFRENENLIATEYKDEL